MKVLYHIPSLATNYANRTISIGFKNAFEYKDIEFRYFTNADNLEYVLEIYTPDIFITATHFYYQKALDFKVLKRFRDKGMKVFVKIDFWDNKRVNSGLNVAKSLKDDIKTIDKIKNNDFGDIYFHVTEQDDERMEGFETNMKMPFYTIPLAADSMSLQSNFDSKFKSEISYVGTNLKAKKDLFDKYLFPLREHYDLKLYGQDWTYGNKILNFIQKTAQYYNVNYFSNIIKPALDVKDEADIYNSSLISINIHNDYQLEFGGDCNERTFKIPLANGFEIVDDVKCIKKYFKENEEITIGYNQEDWFEKIDYFIRYPEKRLQIIEAGKERVLKDHTYINRVEQIVNIYNSLRM